MENNKKKMVKLIYLISRVFWSGLFFLIFSPTVHICVCFIFGQFQIEAYQIMFNAEATEITDDRERVKHLTNLSWDSPGVQALHENNQIKMSIFRFLLAQFSINFKRLWAPTLKVIDSFVSGWEDWNSIWITWLDIFQDINVKAATKCVQDASE